MRFSRIPWHFPALVAALLLVSSARGADKERWYQVRMSNANAGWMRSVERTENDRISSTSEMTIKIKRGPTEVGISVKSETVETTDGKPVSMKSTQSMGADPVETLYSYEDGKFTVTTEQAGRKTVTEKPYPPGEWMTPAAASRYVEEQIRKGEKSITVRTVDPMSGPEPVTMTHKIFEKQKLTVGGGQIEVTRTTNESSIAPGVITTEYLDEEGELVRSETSIGGIKMVLIAAGPEVVNAKIGEAPEMMQSTFIKPDRAIANPRTTKRAVYVLSVKEGELPEIPTVGAQRVEKIDARSARVTVDIPQLPPAPKEDVDNRNFREPSASLDSADEAIQRLARRATQKAGQDASAKAEAMRKFVSRYITGKSLNIAFATASEVCKNRAGDCSEHGVLLAAMLRAGGIPSRVVAGVIYADEFAGSKSIFGYHMWAQALIDTGKGPAWVDLDGTLDGDTPFDATHIVFGTSALADDEGPTAMIAMASLLGRVQIKVESIE